MPPEFTGGIGLGGAAALEQFAREGGTLVALDSAADLPIDLFGLGVRNVLKGVSNQEYFAPGGLLRISYDTSQPLAWGMPKDGVSSSRTRLRAGAAAGTTRGEEEPALAPPATRSRRSPPTSPAGTPLPRLAPRRVKIKKASLVEAPLRQGV